MVLGDREQFLSKVPLLSIAGIYAHLDNIGGNDQRVMRHELVGSRATSTNKNTQ